MQSEYLNMLLVGFGQSINWTQVIPMRCALQLYLYFFLLQIFPLLLLFWVFSVYILKESFNSDQCTDYHL